MNRRHALVWSICLVAMPVTGMGLASAEPLAAGGVSLPGEAVTEVAFSTDGRHLVLHEEGTARVVSLETGDEVGAVELEVGDTAVHVLPGLERDVRVLVEGSAPALRVLPGEARVALPAGLRSPSASAVSHDGRRYAVLVAATDAEDSATRHLRIYDLQRDRLDVEVEIAPDESMWEIDHVTVVFSPDDERVLVALGEFWSAGCGGGDERTRVGLYRVSDGEKLAFESGYDVVPPWLSQDAVTPAGRWLTSCDDSGRCVAWDLADPSATPAVDVIVHGVRDLAGVVPSADDDRAPMLVFADRLVDLSKSDDAREQSLPPDLLVDEASATADGRFVMMHGATVAGARVTVVWSVEEQRITSCLQTDAGAAVRAIASPTDATRVAVLTPGGAVELQRVGRPGAEPLACAGLIP